MSEQKSVEGFPQYAHIKVVDGPLTSFPIVERVFGGWQSGVMFYPDSLVESYKALRLVPEDQP